MGFLFASDLYHFERIRTHCVRFRTCRREFFSVDEAVDFTGKMWESDLEFWDGAF